MESFTAAEIESQLHSLTYEHPILAEQPVLADVTIDHEDLAKCCPLDYGRHKTPSSSTFTMGIFEALPAEICRLIFMELDVEGLVASGQPTAIYETPSMHFQSTRPLLNMYRISCIHYSASALLGHLHGNRFMVPARPRLASLVGILAAFSTYQRAVVYASTAC